MTRRAMPAALLIFIGCGGDRAAFDGLVRETRAVEASLQAMEHSILAGHAPDALAELAAGGIPSRASLELAGMDRGAGEGPARLDVRLELGFDGPPRRLVRARVSAVAGTPPARGIEITGVRDVARLAGEPVPAFRDATTAAGLTDVHREPDLDVRNHLVLGIWPGSGAGAADVDGDGDVDLLALDGRRSLLYENDGAARFTDATDRRGLGGLVGTGACFADLDADGDPDLLVTNAFGGNRLFENRGGVFADLTGPSGTGASPKGSSAVAGDADGDGLLDLYVCNSGDYYAYLPEPPWNARNGYPNVLYMNRGGLRFEDRAAEAGVASTGWSLAAAFSDMDADGDQDLYVANDFGGNQLYRNRGGGTFDEIASRAGALDRGYGMSVTWGDADDDGDEDLYVSNIESHYAFLMDDPGFPLPFMGRLFRFRVVPMMKGMLSGNSLLRNDGAAAFTDATDEAGVARGGWSWGALFLDYDGDGLLDLFSPNGFVSGPSREESELAFWVDSSARWNEYMKGRAVFDMAGRSLHGFQRDALFRNVGAGRFHEVAFLEGADLEGDARGAVRADVDGDGRPDLYVRHVQQAGALLLNQRRGPGRVALSLRLATGGPAEGAVVRLRVGGRTLRRVVRSHEGYFSSHDPTLCVGIGDAREVEEVAVRWPSGRTERHGPLAEGMRLDWREGQAPAASALRP